MLTALGPLCLYSLSLIGAVDAAIGPVRNVVIANKKISPDGYQRSATLAGTTQDAVVFPGPPIIATKGDQFSLNVINKLSDPVLLNSTSIHWHGIHQTKGSNWADGAAFVTQCPISKSESFTYEFNANAQVGTFWYYSTLSTQSCDGLRGPLIIRDPLDPYLPDYDVDDESTIITLSDWYHQTYTGGVPPLAASTLINGKGRYVNGPPADLAIINVVKGQRYRFRVIAMSCEPSFNFAIDNHMMTVIEADGQYTQPLVVDNIQIFPGQRYSVIVTANQPVGNYWLRANPDARAQPGFDNLRNLAILRYSGAPNANPTVNPAAPTTANKPLNEYDLHSLLNPSAPGLPFQGGADVAYNFAIGVDPQTNHFTMNGVPFIPPTAPVLLQVLSGTQNAQDLLPKGSVYPLPRNKVIEITIPGSSPQIGGPHPFHLHGHAFTVVRSAGSQSYNYLDSPVVRDTVSTGDTTDNTTIRFVTDNSGTWLLRCQMAFHYELGLAVVFAEDIPGIPAKIHPPQEWDELCSLYD